MDRNLEFYSLRNVVLSNEEIAEAIMQYSSFNREEGCAICREARRGNRVAQCIVGMALLKAHHSAAKDWLQLSAEQDFEPAKRQLLQTRCLSFWNIGKDFIGKTVSS